MLLDDARALEDAGCFSIVLESRPRPPGRLHHAEGSTSPPSASARARAQPARSSCLHDLIGLSERLHTAKFVKRYAEVGGDITRAVAAYRQDVEARAFPGPEQSYTMADEEWESFRAGAGERRPRPVHARAR